MFALLPKGKNKNKITSTKITDRYYGKGNIPLNGRKIVIGLLSSLKRKVTMNRESFKVMKTKRSGPLPMSFWIE